ncbi:MAG: TIGR01212 family radical SAM protein [Lachnospiraceae bacterium]
MKQKWGEKPYYSLDWYLKQRFQGKIYKVALNGGMTCPNRDGTIGVGGCIFCSEGGSGDFAGKATDSITEQINQGIANTAKFHAKGYIAYFQAFTNTYAPIERLRQLYMEAASHPQVVAVSIATRPDCLPVEVLELLSEVNQIKPVWVELGLQTIHEETAVYIRRGYPLSCYEEAVRALRERNIEVITHVILGLPKETKEDMLKTIDYLNQMDIQGVKLQLLHVLKHTDLARDYEAGKFEVLSEEEYIDLTVSCIARLDPKIVIHRVTGDGPKDLLIAPLWSCRKMSVLNEIHHELKIREIRQGCERREKEW